MKRAELRDLEREILFAQRELIPLTTGLIVETKKNRSQRLREVIWRRRRAAVRIQALWRTALVRKTLYDENKSYWVMRYDQEESDEPYYYNLMSKEKVWKQPLGHRYFGELLPEQLQYLQLAPPPSSSSQQQQMTSGMMLTRQKSSRSSRSLR